MADARAFRALRFDPARVDPALAIAPPYDVISREEQRALYERGANNIVRIEYGEERPADNESDNRYTRAARDLSAWRRDGILIREGAPALYAYQQRFEWGGRAYERSATFAVVRLEEWEKGIVKPHERTLSAPKQDRLTLLRATRTQISPVYGIVRAPKGTGSVTSMDGSHGAPLYDFSADSQHHRLSAVEDAGAIAGFASAVGASDVYIADGHHRYETALAYRDEVRARADRWTGDEPENFVLMALTPYDDAGLLVLPTHRLLRVGSQPSAQQFEAISERFEVTRVDGAMEDDEAFASALEILASQTQGAFLALGLRPGEAHLLAVRDRSGIEGRMPAEEPAAWKRLDVNVLEYGVLRPVFQLDEAALREGAVSYTQDARDARRAVRTGEATLGFILNATPVEQVLAVADAGARMPQKSTYFHPKLPTGLVMHAFD